jgi:hypothetical protein
VALAGALAGTFLGLGTGGRLRAVLGAFNAEEHVEALPLGVVTIDVSAARKVDRLRPLALPDDLWEFLSLPRSERGDMMRLRVRSPNAKS